MGSPPASIRLECLDLVKSLEAGLHWIPPPYTSKATYLSSQAAIALHYQLAFLMLRFI